MLLTVRDQIVISILGGFKEGESREI